MPLGQIVCSLKQKLKVQLRDIFKAFDRCKCVHTWMESELASFPREKPMTYGTILPISGKETHCALS